MGKSKDLATGASYVDVSGDGMTGNLGVGGAANGSYAITSHSSGGQNLRFENDNEYAFFRLDDNGDLKIWAHGDDNLVFMNGDGSGTTRMNIDGSGRVTMPSQPFIECKGNSNSSYSYTADQVVAHWTNKTTPVGITRSGGRFTVPVAGKYLFCFTLYSYTTSAGHYRNRININGSTHSLTQLEISSGARIDTHYDHTLMSSHILNMSANDYVEIIASSAQVMYRGDVHNALSMMLIG